MVEERKIKEQMEEEVEGAKESHLNSSKVREQNKHRQEDRSVSFYLLPFISCFSNELTEG